jgi:hypothetical protein
MGLPRPHTRIQLSIHCLGLVKARQPDQLLWGILFCLIEKNLPPGTLDAFFKAVNSALEVHSKGDAFVDDAQLTATLALLFGHSTPTTPQEVESLLRSLQAMAQSWERLSFTTGGALNLQKSFWTLITWNWKNGTATMATPQQAQYDFKFFCRV